jgi:class 3 adenylate cyclase/tetratricopeptide (TPR) repeat protein
VRKTVTVLFCDVVGSTELGERFDPEVVRGVMSRFYAAIRAPVERHGGTVEKVIGDALVAVFGIPTVHEDDALRAARAALEMRDAVRALGEVEARIGVNTGDVLARDATPGESLMVGDAVNVAARLESAAAPGEVLVGEATWALIGHAARGEPVAPITAKGKREPLVAWRLSDVDPAAGGHRRRLDLPLVGRQWELDLLRWAVGRTAQIRRPHRVTVLGPPGIGKSRLVSEVARLQSDLIVLTGQCRASSGASPLGPLLEVARNAARGGATVEQGVAARMPGDPDASAVAACLAPESDAPAPDVAWAASRLIGTMAVAGPVVLVFEDVHWADDLLLDTIEQLLDGARRQSLLILCTARPEFAERRSESRGATNTISVALERLDDAETRSLVANASPALSHDRSDQVIAAAEGNPLFAEHLAALVGEGAAPGAVLPRSIQVLLAARLEALPESEREVVSVAAVVGREFPADVVEALVGRSIESDLEHLAALQLLEPTSPGRQQFSHALLQETAYGLISKRERSELHLRLAGQLDAVGASDALVGNNLDRAYTLRSELGQVDPETAELRERAGTTLVRAGRRADAMGDPRNARVLLERALELLPEGSAMQAAAMVELAAAGWNLLPKAESVRLLIAGADLAAKLGLRALELRARIILLGVEPAGTDLPSISVEDTLEATNAALQELELLDAPRALAAALCTRAECEWTLGRAGAGVEAGLRAVEVSRAANEDTVWALSVLGYTIVDSPMPVSEAEALLSALMGDLGVRPTARNELMLAQATMALLGGHESRGWSLLEAAEQFDRDIGRRVDWRVTRVRAEMLMVAERFDEAAELLPQVVALEEQRGDESSTSLASSMLGLARVRLGKLDHAIDDAVAVIAMPTGYDRYEAPARARMLLAEARLATGDVSGAVEPARTAVAIAATGDWALLNADAQLLLARALAACGEPERAAEAATASLAGSQAKEFAAGVTRAASLLESLR